MISEKEGIKIKKTIGGDLDVGITRIDYTQITFGVDFENKLQDYVSGEDFMCIIDSRVWKFHQYRFKGMKCIVIEAGDENKNQQTLDMIIDAAISHKISRTGFFVAVGGGTVTDMTGFAANNYFRGIKYINIPTTLLGMVDAAVGGKTAVNHEYQKNMIGSFYHPSAIIYDFSFLNTLDERSYSNGFGEIIKVALLSDKNLFERLIAIGEFNYTATRQLKEIIAITVEEKLRMLGSNCFERDLRRPLNLGHTIAHPIEDITDFKIYHGEAVAIGCLFASYISLQRQKLSLENYTGLVDIVDQFNLLTYARLVYIDKELLWDRLQRLVMQRGGTGLLYVYPVGVGDCEIVENITRDEFDKAYEFVIAKMYQETHDILQPAH